MNGRRTMRSMSDRASGDVRQGAAGGGRRRVRLLSAFRAGSRSRRSFASCSR